MESSLSTSVSVLVCQILAHDFLAFAWRMWEFVRTWLQAWLNSELVFPEIRWSLPVCRGVDVMGEAWALQFDIHFFWLGLFCRGCMTVVWLVWVMHIASVLFLLNQICMVPKSKPILYFYSLSVIPPHQTKDVSLLYFPVKYFETACPPPQKIRTCRWTVCKAIGLCSLAYGK